MATQHRHVHFYTFYKFSLYVCVIVFMCIIPIFMYVDYKDMPQGIAVSQDFFLPLFGIWICIYECGCEFDVS